MIGLIGALKEEMAIVLSRMDNVSAERISSVDFFTGSIAQKQVCAAVCGMGKVNAAVCAQIMITRFGVDAIINTGIGGALDPALRQLDMVVSSGFVQHDFDVSPIDDVEPGYIAELGCVVIPADKRLGDVLFDACSAACPDCSGRGIFATGDQFIADREFAGRLRERFGASVCDMESGAMVHVCSLAGVPFAAVRCISDSADDSSENTYFDFKETCCRRGSEIILNALGRL